MLRETAQMEDEEEVFLLLLSDELAAYMNTVERVF